MADLSRWTAELNVENDRGELFLVRVEPRGKTVVSPHWRDSDDVTLRREFDTPAEALSFVHTFEAQFSRWDD